RTRDPLRRAKTEAASLMATPKFWQNRLQNDNLSYIAGLYQDILHRAASQNELESWVEAMDTSNLGRQQLVQTFLNSTERRIQIISGDYLQYFGRAPDQAGLTGWLNFLANGGSLDAVADDILSSQEYFQRQGNTNAAFVQSLYQNVLGRPTSPVEGVAWIQ